MGVDVEAKLVHVPVEAGTEQINLLKENGKPYHGSGITEPIKFGSHGTEEPKEEASRIPVNNVPKDAVEDWPEPKKIHSFYTVKFRRFEDPKLRAKIELGEKELQKKNQTRSQIIEKLKAKRAEKSNVVEQRKALSAENKEFWSTIEGKKKEMEPLQEALGQGPMVCSSEEELNQLIKSLQYRIQHESIPLNEEKQILREIKQLEGTREEVKKVAAERAKIQETMGEKESIQNQVKLMNVGLDGVHKGRQEVKAKLKLIDEQLLALNKQINILDEELKEVVEKRDKTYEHILELRKQREEGNSSFYQNSNLLHKVKQLADQKDVGALKELSVTEVDKFISLWCGSKSFRDDYERRILQSLDIRQLSWDGRMRNPDEKSLVLPEAPTVSRAEVPERANAKPVKEDAAPIQKEQQEKSGNSTKRAHKKDVDDDEEEIYGLDILKDINPKKNEVDEATLNEMKKEEEIAKNKQAMERKRKLAEKAAAKAAKKALLEAERKLKEREKRARKKGGSSVQEPTETPEEVAEEENIEEIVETTVAPKVKARKENTVRHRATRVRGSDLPKAILKRKKATNYWLWAAAPAALAILVLLVVGYMYLQK
ncbi:unnamed protein product [Withania somnifera]